MSDSVSEKELLAVVKLGAVQVQSLAAMVLKRTQERDAALARVVRLETENARLKREQAGPRPSSEVQA